MHDNKEDNHIL